MQNYQMFLLAYLHRQFRYCNNKKIHQLFYLFLMDSKENWMKKYNAKV